MSTLGCRPLLFVGRLLLVGALLATAACGDDDGDDRSSDEGREATTTTAATAAGRADEGESGEGGGEEGDVTWVAQAEVPEVAVYPEPDADAVPSHRLGNPNENGAPLVFLVDGPRATGDWVRVVLPVAPQGSTGWVRAADVAVARHAYRLRVELAAHRLTLTEGGEVRLEAPIGVGAADAPAPGGSYFVTELLQPPDPAGAYGPFAYGLSGFSNGPTQFNGGTGVVGIHGTNEPQSVGTDVGAGCIRLTNEVITQLAAVLPLGTPVEIAP